MSLFKHKKQEVKKYDTENLIPVIHASICSGEMVVGFKDKRDGKFTEMMLIESQSDLEKFKKLYDIKEEIKKEY
ncbi:MAG: hypothetical protein K6F81_05120 [Acholeplasmatales bacterium]|nr:hypothetical protein [Acholeplasmatales bacterium]